MDQYPQIIAFVFTQEGGYTNDPRDPGGATNWGITIYDARLYWKKDATPADVRAMPKAVAATIYFDKYWKVISGPTMPGGINLCVMDSAVNSGTGRADKWLAKALGVTVNTATSTAQYANLAQEASKAPNLDPIIDKYAAVRLSFLHSLRTWSAFSKGWGRRVSEMKAQAHVLYRQALGMDKKAIQKDLQGKTTEVAKKQKTDVAVSTGTTGGQVTYHWYNWHWDTLHILLLVAGCLLFAYVVRRVIINIHDQAAFKAAIAALDAPEDPDVKV